MTSEEVRESFLKYFKSKDHQIVPSAPIVVKNDPTLMFTNAGMNQFKDYFLGNRESEHTRIADTQKCLRVSGKHNDLEEVGVDTYHHTMFEMLGNWSFGDYFKEEAIEWAWELLTKVYKLEADRLYVTVFEGDESDKLPADTESENIWKKHIDPNRILRCNKKDNFWEMGDTGPCGSCSEIHMDLRSEQEREKIDGKHLVNADHPQVIELWNLVFMEFNRLSNGSLVNLPAKHVDTGMGLERVVRAIALQNSNYDTDLFQNTISKLESLCDKKYGDSEKVDIAFRVIADHIRALAFCIADGQLPSNTGAGYVIRRILRRAVRYGYSFLDFQQPFLFKLIDTLADNFKNIFPELKDQSDFVATIIEQEESSFFRTLFAGLEDLEGIFNSGNVKKLDGRFAFELYDTFGFPFDLTQLIATEHGIAVDEEGFKKELAKQKDRSRADAVKTTGDWTELRHDEIQEFIGYDHLTAEVFITRYRSMESKGKTKYQLVFNLTPFYGESGGQVGDTGQLTGVHNGEVVHIVDTQKENNLIVHVTEKLPGNIEQAFMANVNGDRREHITKNHSATHLMHSALREVLGDHVAQKGSLVDDQKFRFDFSHFQKPTDAELKAIENMVNQKIRESIPLWEDRTMPYDQAIEKGVTALFGEKYGDLVRVVVFDEEYSMELCGGTHVSNTSVIGGFKITSESSVASGVRRIEAITGDQFDKYIEDLMKELQTVHEKLGHPQNLQKALDDLIGERDDLLARIKQNEKEQEGQLVEKFLDEAQVISDVSVVVQKVSLPDPASAKDIAYKLREKLKSCFVVLAVEFDEKPNVTVMMSDELVKSHNLNAGNLVREWGKLIKGGGGGQPFFAQAGGKDVSGLDKVVTEAKKLAKDVFS